MSGTHRPAPASPGSPTNTTNAAGAAKRSAKALWFPASIAVSFAGFAAAVMVANAEPETVEEQPATSAYTAVAQPQTLTQQGTVVAVTADSITARSVDGHIQTYRVTPATTAVTSNGGQSFHVATPFTVNDEVAIQATVTSGMATATAVADRAVIGQHGLPMDSV